MRFIRFNLALLYVSMVVLASGLHLLADPCTSATAHAGCAHAAPEPSEHDSNSGDSQPSGEPHHDSCLLCKLLVLQAESPAALPACQVSVRLDAIPVPPAHIYTVEVAPLRKARSPPAPMS